MEAVFSRVGCVTAVYMQINAGKVVTEVGLMLLECPVCVTGSTVHRERGRESSICCVL